MIRLTLPFPPSGNNQRMPVGRRLIDAPRYRAWKVEADKAVRAQRPGSTDSAYVLTLTADRPDRRARDIGNLEKCCSDTLVRNGIVRDDSDAEEITLRWSDRKPGKGAAVHVRIEPA